MIRLPLQAAIGWLSGEKQLLQHGLKRFGPNVSLLQKYFLPTKTAESINNYIAVSLLTTSNLLCISKTSKTSELVCDLSTCTARLHLQKSFQLSLRILLSYIKLYKNCSENGEEAASAWKSPVNLNKHTLVISTEFLWNHSIVFCASYLCYQPARQLYKTFNIGTARFFWSQRRTYIASVS